MKSEGLLHTLIVGFLENIKPGIYVTDPIPKPKFVQDEYETTIFCPYCSYPGAHCHIEKTEFYDHLKSKSHLKQFIAHHYPTIDKQTFKKLYLVVNNLDKKKLEEYIGTHLDILHARVLLQ